MVIYIIRKIVHLKNKTVLTVLLSYVVNMFRLKCRYTIRYGIRMASSTKVLNLENRTKSVKILLLLASKDVREPLVPMLFPSFCAHISFANIQCFDHK